MPTKVSCKTCGKEIYVRPSKLLVGTNQYCSRDCSWKSQRIDIKKEFFNLIDKQDCWIWLGSKTYQNYGRITSQGKTTLAHRLSYEIHFGSFNKSLFVCHSCDNPICVNPDHLFLGTQQDNVDDAMKKGRMATGERVGRVLHPEKYKIGEGHGRAKLTNIDVMKIKDLSKTTKGAEIARMFNVTSTAIYQIINRITWKHLS